MKKLLVILFLLISISIYAQETVTYMGKTYHVIKIGNQSWLQENLDVGTTISVPTPQTNNNILEKYYLNNDSVSSKKYGGLYQWGEAMKYSTISKSQGICPTGYHIPSKSEFDILTSFVNNDANKLKTIEAGGNNQTLFSAMMTGYSTGKIFQPAFSTFYWTSTNSTSPYSVSLSQYSNSIVNQNSNIDNAFCVRCIKDSVLVSVGKTIDIPFSTELSQNYPNPFNGQTVINYTLKETTPVTITVSDVLGRTISVVLDEVKSAGNHSVTFNAQNISSGTYIVTMRTLHTSFSMKMILIK